MARADDSGHVDRLAGGVAAGNLADLLEALGMTFERYCRLLELIYQGPLETTPCSSAMMDLRGCLQANGSVLILRPAQANAMAIVIRDRGRGPKLSTSVYTQFPIFSLDPFVGLPADRAVTIDEIIDPDKWVQSAFFKQYVEPRQVRYILGVDIHGDGGREFRLRFTRPADSVEFSATDKGLVQALAPHFRRALDFHGRLGQMETEMQLYASVMRSMLVGSVILDGAGKILRTNSVAQAMLEEKDGLAVRAGGLATEYRNEDRELQRLVRQTLSTPPGQPAMAEALSVTRPSGRASLNLLIRPIPLIECSEGPNRPTAVIFIRDPEHQAQLPVDLVQSLFHFTPAEAKLALLLTDGLSLDEAADALGIRKNTVRAQLRSIFSKTGVTRQTTLVRLLLNSVASISR